MAFINLILKKIFVLSNHYLKKVTLFSEDEVKLYHNIGIFVPPCQKFRNVLV